MLQFLQIETSDKYRTIAESSQGEYKEKGSKFIAHAIHVKSEDEAKEHIERLRKEHPKAVHVCFAWKIGLDQPLERFSDDGEPNNSAGKPIFGQITAFDVTNILIAVVRYYGGTNLGVGGLITAYKTASKQAMESAKIVDKFLEVDAIIRFDAQHTGDLMTRLSKSNIDIQEHSADQKGAFVKVTLRKSRAQKIIDNLEELPYYKIEVKA